MVGPNLLNERNSTLFLNSLFSLDSPKVVPCACALSSKSFKRQQFYIRSVQKRVAHESGASCLTVFQNKLSPLPTVPCAPFLIPQLFDTNTWNLILMHNLQQKINVIHDSLQEVLEILVDHYIRLRDIMLYRQYIFTKN